MSYKTMYYRKLLKNISEDTLRQKLCLIEECI